MVALSERVRAISVLSLMTAEIKVYFFDHILTPAPPQEIVKNRPHQPCTCHLKSNEHGSHCCYCFYKNLVFNGNSVVSMRNYS